MPKFTAETLSDLKPLDTVDWTLPASYPKDNPNRIVLLLKWAGSISAFAKEMKKRATEALQDPIDETERQLRIFAKTAVAGWRNVLDANGQPESFSARDCGELLAVVLRESGDMGYDDATSMMKAAGIPAVFRRPPPPSAADLGKE